MPIPNLSSVASRVTQLDVPAPASGLCEESESMSYSKLVRRELTVELENGLHMVPCSSIAKAVQQFGGPVRIIRGELVVDASSVFDLLGLGAQRGTVLILEADGDGAETLLDQIAQVFRRDSDGRR